MSNSRSPTSGFGSIASQGSHRAQDVAAVEVLVDDDRLARVPAGGSQKVDRLV
ncbi:MAG: hypothetical protein ACRDMY_09205 [Gaiellaceae bacterium]